MSKYTTTIKNLMDNNFNFGLESYPIFDENYRQTLNNKILYHYYENEIGFETAGLFKIYLNQKMDEIMPYYNNLYNIQSEMLKNPMGNVDITETFTRTSSTNTSANSSSNNIGENNNKNVFLDTPQGNLYKGDIDSTNYATNVTWDRNNTNNSITDNSTSQGSGTEDYVKHIIGNNGNKYAVELIEQIKNNLMNIDLMIIEELNELFMQIF